MTIIVNPIYLDYLFGTLSGLGDSEDDINVYGMYDTNNERQTKTLARELLLPEFIKQNPLLVEQIKNSLAYYLLNPSIEFKDRIESLLLPFKTPDDGWLFFQWIWEVFFEGESYDYLKDEDVFEEFDINAPYKLLTGNQPPNTPSM
ncbi:hypothetical protein [Lacibacter sp. H407]|jgi:hypothetical protein|uniref:hypothetical protein n=1 Tax=Lacibacter sp. H407 TaxID=3133423 RepID=UPI0030BA7796